MWSLSLTLMKVLSTFTKHKMAEEEMHCLISKAKDVDKWRSVQSPTCSAF